VIWLNMFCGDTERNLKHDGIGLGDLRQLAKGEMKLFIADECWRDTGEEKRKKRGNIEGTRGRITKGGRGDRGENLPSCRWMGTAADGFI